MTEEEWLTCEDPRWLLEHLRKQARSRKLRLFACACVRRVWRRIPNPVCRQALEVAEQYADREVKNATRQQAHRAARALCRPGVSASVSLASFVTHGPRYTHVDASGAAQRAIFAITGKPAAKVAERATQAEVCRDIFGNPFRPVTLNPAWRTSNVTALAQAIYDERAFDRLPILADALEDAGCDNGDILNHCRQPGEHVRGCWVVDMILGKE